MEKVIFSDLNKFKEIKQNLMKGGFENLHVISDFDRTLTKAFIKGGEHVPSVISILRDEEGYLTKDYPQKARDLFEKYHPIEIDVSVPKAQKINAMELWWKGHAELLINSGLNKKDLEQVATSNRILFRNKTLESITLLEKNEVPFVILSANGLGDESVIEVLKFHNLNLPNVSVISNKYIWDRKGNAVGYNNPLIHTFNKSEVSIKLSPVYETIKKRKNVVLLGDSIGDVGMIDGFDYDNLLKIGFLNFDVSKNLENYKQHYDVVITNDSSMEFVYDLLKNLN